MNELQVRHQLLPLRTPLLGAVPRGAETGEEDLRPFIMARNWELVAAACAQRIHVQCRCIRQEKRKRGRASQVVPETEAAEAAVNLRQLGTVPW